MGRLERPALQARAGLPTRRERELFGLLAASERNKAIARQFRISIRTIELHEARISEKLRAPSLSDLIREGTILEAQPNASAQVAATGFILQSGAGQAHGE